MSDDTMPSHWRDPREEVNIYVGQPIAEDEHVVFKKWIHGNCTTGALVVEKITT